MKVQLTKVQLTYEIRLASDYHAGAGYGAGFGIDSALLRDADGVPVLRGTALAGLLRDSLQRLLQTPVLRHLDADSTLERLFGSPLVLKRWHISSARPIAAPKPLRTSAWKSVRDAQTVQRVRVSPRTRRAEAGKLFSNEEGDGALRFRFTATCHEDGPAAQHDAALLTAAARNLHSLGRSRRRGAGSCTLHLVAVDGLSLPPDQEALTSLLELLRTVWLEGNPAPLPQKPNTATALVASLHKPAADHAVTRLRVVLRLDEPLIVAERSPAGNQFRTKAIIGGGVLLGALAGLAAHRLDLHDPADYRAFTKSFLAGGVRCSALHYAYEENNHLYVTVPAPFDWLTCKAHPFTQQQLGHGVFAPFELGGPERCPVPNCNSAVEAVSGHIVLKRQAPYTAGPQLASELHIRIDEKRQRVAAGDLYGYTALEAGQYFIGELYCTAAAWQTLQETAGLQVNALHHLHLGKARRRGYGAVSLWLEELPAEPLPIPWAQRQPDPTQPVAITLLSDTIVVDAWGRQPAGFEAGWLETALGLGPLSINAAYARRTVIDGFNTYRGVPRWRSLALEAGSTVWVTMVAPPESWDDQMQAIERSGIGQRRDEGFGRIAFHYLHSGKERAHIEILREVTMPVAALRREMQLGSAVHLPADVKAGKTFERDWNGWLAREVTPKLRVKGEPKRFQAMAEALARWLHAQAGNSPQATADALAVRGDEQTVAAAIAPMLDGPESNEFGARKKANYYADDGKELRTAAGQALIELKKYAPGFWPPGIRRLAEVIAQGYVTSEGAESGAKGVTHHE